jgi:cytoskeletal protein CcmA (bactofilin family)
MWKKEEGVFSGSTARVEPTPTPRSERVSAAPERTVPMATARTDLAIIGRSITIRGEVTGDEDLLIEGRVDGSVNLKQHAVTVGPEGEVKANIVGRVITVEGNVTGNLNAEEQVVLRSSALLQGDIAAPRLVLEDGARFVGGVDMGEVVDRTPRTATAATKTGTTTRHESTPKPEASTDTDTGTAKGEGKASGTGEGSSRGTTHASR